MSDDRASASPTFTVRGAIQAALWCAIMMSGLQSCGSAPETRLAGPGFWLAAALGPIVLVTLGVVTDRAIGRCSSAALRERGALRWYASMVGLLLPGILMIRRSASGSEGALLVAMLGVPLAPVLYGAGRWTELSIAARTAGRERSARVVAGVLGALATLAWLLVPAAGLMADWLVVRHR
jgi:hypothetical protein